MLQKRDIIKLKYTSSEEQNVRSDQSSLSFRVGHCHTQLIGTNKYIKYITEAEFRKLMRTFSQHQSGKPKSQWWFVLSWNVGK